MTVDELLQQGISCHRAGDLVGANALYSQVINLQADHFAALYLSGLLSYGAGKPAESEKFLRRALDSKPVDPDCLNALGLALGSQEKLSESESCFRSALAAEPSPELFNNLGLLLKRQGRLAEANQAFQSALAQDPACQDALYNLGNMLRSQGNVEEAIGRFRQLLKFSPSHADALAALGQSLLMLKDPEAEAILRIAVLASPEDAALRCDLGDALAALAKPREAAAEYACAIEKDARLSRPWYSIGCLQNERRAFADAAECFRKVLSLSPGWLEAKHNLGHALFELGRIEEAVACFREAALGPSPELPVAMIAVAIPGSPSATNEQIFEARRAWAEIHPSLPNPPSPKLKPRPLRIGYISSFFARDNWMKPVWALINRHDRKRFEINLFSDQPASQIKHGYNAHPSDHFHETAALTNDELSALIRRSGIDLLIDLNGYSNMRRLPLFASRPAAVIAGWFNFYATTGMNCFDCLIADREVLPHEEERFYSEKILRVPGSYLTFEVAYPVPQVAAPPVLATGKFTFGCLAPLYKVTPQVVQTFAQILTNVPSASLLLKNNAFSLQRNADYVRASFEEQGIDACRLQLEGPAGHYQFLETYSRIDLALDTFPYNGGTTTTEALWQGVPVVTFRGDRWVSRTSASILLAANLPQFVCRDLPAYITLATDLATSPEGTASLAALRQNMRPYLSASPACATEAFARNMERLYFSMFFDVNPPVTESN